MKKITGMAAILAAPLWVNAQNTSPYIDKDIFNICATIFVVGMFMIFILAILKRIMDYRLKNKIVEKGISETAAASILQSNPKEDRNNNIKWFAILTGMGVGLTVVYYTSPLGIHSLAIMAFSVAASFLAYFLFLKQSER